ncbi:hypothetical protein HY497_00605 [Candidatus Woesearchaeota archaeon]|nr:hypothetical protein [Candidatus Woesearchaeota archaeon]
MPDKKDDIMPLPPGASSPEGSMLNTRIRVLEEKASNLNRKIELLESNVVKGNKKRNETLRAFDNDLLEMKRDLTSVKQKIDLIVRELKLTAGKDELNIVKRYLDLWNLARFVTRDEIEQIVEEKVSEGRILRKDL